MVTLMTRSRSLSQTLRLAGPGLLPLLVVLAGCGNLTAGGLSEAEVTVSGDATDPPVAQATAGQGTMGAEGESEAEGEIEAEFIAYLENGSGASEPLSAGPIRVRVDVQGVREEGTGIVAVPAGRYTALRLAFTEIEVEVDAGLIVNGQEITGIVPVDFEADSLTVVKPVRLDLEAGDRIELLVDMNTQDWLFQVDPDLQVVAEQIVANSITVRVR